MHQFDYHFLCDLIVLTLEIGPFPSQINPLCIFKVDPGSIGICRQVQPIPLPMLLWLYKCFFRVPLIWTCKFNLILLSLKLLLMTLSTLKHWKTWPLWEHWLYQFIWTEIINVAIVMREIVKKSIMSSINPWPKPSSLNDTITGWFFLSNFYGLNLETTFHQSTS